MLGLHLHFIYILHFNQLFYIEFLGIISEFLEFFYRKCVYGFHSKINAGHLNVQQPVLCLSNIGLLLLD